MSNLFPKKTQGNVQRGAVLCQPLNQNIPFRQEIVLYLKARELPQVMKSTYVCFYE